MTALRHALGGGLMGDRPPEATKPGKAQCRQSAATTERRYDRLSIEEVKQRLEAWDRQTKGRV